MIEHMSDHEPPRVRFTLPGGAQTTGRLLRWRQDKTGTWWAEVATYAPASAVQQVTGEDYDDVPREPARPTHAAAAEYVFDNARRAELILTLHRADCPVIPAKIGIRLTPATADEARAQLKVSGTAVCDVCNPAP